jgi:hypothetical protein
MDRDLPSESIFRFFLPGSEDVFHDAAHIPLLKLLTNDPSGRVHQELIPTLDPFDALGAQKS